MCRTIEIGPMLLGVFWVQQSRYDFFSLYNQERELSFFPFRWRKGWVCQGSVPRLTPKLEILPSGEHPGRALSSVKSVAVCGGM
jgi:hypothetical protein